MRKKKLRKKSKKVGVALAVVVGFFAWAYTYKHDAWKFWVGLVISLTLWWMFFIPNLLVWGWAIIDMTIKDKRVFEK